MEGDAKGERNEKGLQSLHTEPKRYVPHNTSLTRWPPLSRSSFQDALRDFFPPIQTGDPRHDFYTMYNKEAMDYDTDNVKKYDEDLNTTLIFVRAPPFTLLASLTCPLRRDYSLLSVQRSLSTLSRNSNPIRTNNPRPSSVRSSSLSTNPLSRVKPRLSHLPRRTHRARLLPSPVSSTQAF